MPETNRPVPAVIDQKASIEAYQSDTFLMERAKGVNSSGGHKKTGILRVSEDAAPT